MGTPGRLRVGARLLRPEEASALVLKSMWGDAVAYLDTQGHTVAGAVVAVPAYFSNAQREAVRLAARLAGIKLVRLVNEPTAAALAYGLHGAPARSTFIVLDLGGGTFDVSILRCHDAMMEVCASAGDNRLGGEDFVEALITLVLEHWTDLPDRQLQPLLQARLWREGERVKRQLGSAERATFSLEWDQQVRQHEVTQAAFAVRVAPLLARMRAPIERALRDAKLRAGDLDQVVLVGGATRMPLVKQLVARMFQRLPAMNIDPDEAVARGAAVLAAMLGNDEALEEMLLIDVCPYSLGTQVVRRQADGQLQAGYSQLLIERNTALPVSREERFYTAYDQQLTVSIDVYQGESRMVADNILLGVLEVPVPPRPAGEVALDVRFTYDASGILEVGVRLPDTGQTRQLVLQSGHEALSDAQVAERLQALAALKVHPRDQQINQALKARAERLYEDLLGDQRRTLGDAIDAFDQALGSQLPARIDPARAKLERLVKAWDSV
jgi:molecular chaperone HscC